MGARITSLSRSSLYSFVLPVIGAVIIGSIIIALSGTPPVEAFSAILEGALSGAGVRNTVARAVPIAGMALVFAIPFRAGVINLGGEGQMLLGGLAGALVAIHAPGPPWAVVLLALMAGILAGAVWGSIPALGQSVILLPILITSLLLNYVARSLTGYLVRFHFNDPTATSTATVPIPLDHRLPTLPIAGGLTISLIFLILLIAANEVHNRRSVAGYETQMTGFNPSFARYGGILVSRQRGVMMIVAGAIAGGVGAHVIVGQLFIYIDGDLVGTAFAWTGLMVALFAPNSPIGMAVGAYLFSALQVGGLAMQRTTDVPWQLALVLQSIVIVMFVTTMATRSYRRRSVDSEPEPELADVGVTA